MEKIKKLVPGTLVCVGLALISHLIAYFLPTVGAATFAIFLGILAGNTVFKSDFYLPGSKFSETELLACSIVLMGASLNLSDVMSVGVNGLLFILLQMALTITAAYFIGRKLGFGKKFSLLMCAGNAVCGSSAIASVAPVVGADSKDKGISITIVNVTGTIMMFLLPLISLWLYQHQTLQTSALIGGTLQSVGQVIASAKFVNDSVVEMSAIFKIIRIIFLIAVVLVFSRMNHREGEGLFAKAQKEAPEKKSKIKVGIPWFIIGFFILSIIHTLHLIPPVVSDAAHWVSGQFEIIALAAIGMKVKIHDLVREGPKALLCGGMIGASQIIFAIILIRLLIW